MPTESDEIKWGTNEWHRLHPIYLKVEDMKLPPSVLIERVRADLSRLRGQLGDIAHGWSGFREEIQDAEGSITLTISYLYRLKTEMEEVLTIEKEYKKAQEAKKTLSRNDQSDIKKKTQ